MNLLPRKFGFDDFFDDFFPAERKEFKTFQNLKCDIYEKDGKCHLEMDIPGFKKEDIKIECENGYLTISAEKEKSNGEDTKKYIRRERYYNKYERSFYVGDVPEDKINAEFKNGILTIIVPTTEKKENKKYISIN